VGKTGGGETDNETRDQIGLTRELVPKSVKVRIEPTRRGVNLLTVNSTGRGGPSPPQGLAELTEGGTHSAILGGVHREKNRSQTEGKQRCEEIKRGGESELKGRDFQEEIWEGFEKEIAGLGRGNSTKAEKGQLFAINGSSREAMSGVSAKNGGFGRVQKGKVSRARKETQEVYLKFLSPR